jgi:hypothetical protein
MEPTSEVRGDGRRGSYRGLLERAHHSGIKGDGVAAPGGLGRRPPGPARPEG